MYSESADYEQGYKEGFERGFTCAMEGHIEAMNSDFDTRIIRNLEGMEKIIERAYFPGRARSLAITKLDECILWLTCARLRGGEAPEHVKNDD